MLSFSSRVFDFIDVFWDMEIFWKFITRIISLMRKTRNFIYKWNITKILSLDKLTTVVRKSGFSLANLKGDNWYEK